MSVTTTIRCVRSLSTRCYSTFFSPPTQQKQENRELSSKYGNRELSSIYGNRELSSSSNFTDSMTGSLQRIEKLVDSPVTFLGIDYLNNEEIFYLLENIQKLIGTKHPIVEFGANTLLGSTGTFRVHGLIALLASQIVNLCNSNEMVYNRDKTGILPKQRRLVEVCEMISTAFFLHDSIVSTESSKERENLQKGNKLSLLFGDYFLATACSQLASFEHPRVVDSISKAIASNVEGRFWLDTIDPTSPPSLPDITRYATLRHGTLLSSCCLSSGLLSGARPDHITALESFGSNVGLAIQLKREVFAVHSGRAEVTSYPYIAAVENLNRMGREVKLGTPPDQVINLGGGVERTIESCEIHCNRALDALNVFQSVDDVFVTSLGGIVRDIKSAKPIVTV